MLTITLVSASLFVLILATATARGGTRVSPVAMTEHGSAVLVWLERNPKPGTPRSRAQLERRMKRRVWRGLALAGVARFDSRRGDVDQRSPFGCIHSHEGPWRIYNPPYAGGLQMDGGFQGTYGSEYLRAYHGAANVWPIWAQVVAAFRAFHGYAGYGPRGYHPWPNTARYCGLIG